VAPHEADPIARPLADLSEIDRETGAPYKLRLAVGQAETPEDQLAVVRQAFPDAQWEEFGEPGGERLSRQTGAAYERQSTIERHIVYRNPETGRPTAVNPSGMDLGDVVQLGPEMLRMGGYAVGAGGAGVGTGGNPVAMAGGGTAGSQAVKYLAEPVVEWVTGLNIPDTRPVAARVKAGALDAAWELAGGFGGELVGMSLRKVGKIPYAVERRTILQQMPPGQGRPGVLKAVEQMAEEQGVSRDYAIRGALPLATRGETVRSFFQAAGKYPKSAETINEALDTTLDVIKRDFQRIHQGAGVGAREKGTAGQAVKWGLKDYAASTSKKQKELEDALEGIVGAKTPVAMENTSAMIQAELSKVPQGAKPGGGVVPADYLDLAKVIEANNGALPFEYVRAFRESIGEATSGGLIAPTGQKTKWYDPLYGAITRDMEAVARAGGRKAETAWAQTQSHWAQRETRLELLRTVANSKEAEGAFRAAVAGANDGPSQLIALQASVPKDAWDDLVAVKLWDMSTTARGADMGDEVTKVFSPSKFVGNWIEMSPASRDVLFPLGTRLRKELDRLALVTAALRESRAAGSGRIGASGTPQGNVFMEMLGDGGMSEIVSGGKVGAVRAAGRALNPFSRARRANRQALLMTDADFVRWLADGTAIPPKPTSVSAHVRRLAGGAFASKPEPVRRAIEEYVLEWRDAVRESSQDSEQEGGTGR